MCFFAVFVVSIFCFLLLSFSLCQVFFRFFPVHRHDVILVIFGGIYFKQSVRLLSIIAGKEKPSMGGALTCTTEIVIEVRSSELKSNTHFSGLRVYLNETDRALKVFLIRTNRNVPVIAKRNAKTSTGYHIFRIFCNEWRRVITPTVRKFKNFNGTEWFQIYPSHAWSIVSIAERPPSIVLCFSRR